VCKAPSSFGHVAFPCFSFSFFWFRLCCSSMFFFVSKAPLSLENGNTLGLASLFWGALAALTLIILLVERLKCSIFVFSKMTILWKENREYFGIVRNIQFFNLKSSKLINYLTDMCWSCPCTMVYLPPWSIISWARSLGQKSAVLEFW